MTYVTFIEDRNGNVVDIETRCDAHGKPGEAWPCYGDNLDAGDVAYCVECGVVVAHGPDLAEDGGKR